MSWDWAQGRGLPARPKASVISAGDSNSCGGSAHPSAFPKQPQPRRSRGAEWGGAGRGESGRFPGAARPLGLRGSPPSACVGTLRPRAAREQIEWREDPGRGLEAGSARELLRSQVWGGVPF